MYDSEPCGTHVQIRRESWGEEDEELKPADSSGLQLGQIHENNLV